MEVYFLFASTEWPFPSSRNEMVQSTTSGMKWVIPLRPEWTGLFWREWNGSIHSDRNGISHSILAGIEWPNPFRPEWTGPFRPEWNGPFHSSWNGMDYFILAGMEWPISAGMKWTISFRPEWNGHSVDANKKYALGPTPWVQFCQTIFFFFWKWFFLDMYY